MNVANAVPTEFSELIDTLWNVNDYINKCISYVICELIDTLWNVNDDVIQTPAGEV